MLSIDANGVSLTPSKIARIVLLVLVIARITLAVIFGEAFDATALQAWIKDTEAAGSRSNKTNAVRVWQDCFPMKQPVFGSCLPC